MHVRCVNHLRQNVKDKLRSLRIPQAGSVEFLRDIFGMKQGTNFEHGLIDCISEQKFAANLKQVQQR